MKNMTDLEQRKQLLRFLKAGNSTIFTVTGKEYKLSQEVATEQYDTFVGTGWITTEDYQVNQDHIVSTERDGSGNKKITTKPQVSGAEK